MQKALTYILLALVCGPLWSQRIPVTMLGVKDGLPQATITCMMQDRDGYVWAGTRDGLARYNGYEFDVLRYSQNDTTSLSNSSITAIVQDIAGNIWVGTNFGLNKLNPQTLHSERFYHWFQDDNSISSNEITSLVCDHYGAIWIGTQNGLNKYNADHENFTIYSIRDNDPSSLSSNGINALLVDRNNSLWVGTDIGLNLLLPEGNFLRYKHLYDDNNSLSDNTILAIAEDYEGHLWVGTRNGLNRFHPSMNVFTRYYANQPKQGMLGSNIINALLVDIDGKLWVGSARGLNQLYRPRGRAGDPMSESYEFQELPNGNVTSLMVDKSGLIWVGTLSAGLNLLNDNAQRFFTSFQYDTPDAVPEIAKSYSFYNLNDSTLLVGTAAGLVEYSLKGDQPKRRVWQEGKLCLEIDAPIRSMLPAGDGSFWLATEGQGLLRFDPKKMSIVERHVLVPKDDKSIPSNRLSCMVKADSSRYWVGTSGGGFGRFDPSTGQFENYRFTGNDALAIRDNNVTCIAKQDDNNIWIGTGSAGLYHLNVNGGLLSQFKSMEKATGQLGMGAINDLLIDTNENLWIATAGGGLSLLPKDGKSFTTYTAIEGLASNVVLALVSDFDGNIWMSTNAGISVLDPSSATFRNYNEQDIPGYNTYHIHAAHGDNQSRLYFGGVNGFSYLYAEGLLENKVIPPIVFTRLNNLSNKREVNSVVNLKMSEDTVRLPHNHSGFTVEFAALNYKQASKNQYAYRVLGLFDQWRYLGNRRFATFSNLAPGAYTLEVKGSNNDGYWNEEPATLRVYVQPAFWQTASFRVLVVFALASILYWLYRAKIRREQHRRLELEQAVELRTQEIAKERDTNAILLREVHHRVKNNLQIIVSLLSLQSRFITDNKITSLFDEIQNRVRSMSLIHQKMYQSKDLSTVDIAEYIKDLSQNLLTTYRVGQKVDLIVDIGVNRFKSDTLTPLGLIINEIISNALKYAFVEDREGTIFVEIKSLSAHRFRMLIGDDGVGMPELIEDDKKSEAGSFGSELIDALTEQLNGSIERLTDVSGTVYQIDFEDLET